MVKCYQKDYPRPQFVRKEWKNLNGEWDFAFDDRKEGVEKGYYRQFEPQYRIRVPFTYETKLSGIGEEDRHDTVWYHTETELTLTDKRILLHFEGCDYETSLWVNQTFIGSHTGGYERFTFDITDAASDGVNHITVMAGDSADKRQMRGKQRWKDQNFDCWYVQTTGIWKTVWIEEVPDFSLKSVKMTPRLQTNELLAEAEFEDKRRGAEAGAPLEGCFLEADICFEGKPVTRVCTPVSRNKAVFTANIYNPDICNHTVMEWLPERPSLYDITFRLIRNGECADMAGSYFGMRDICTRGGQVLLNGSPLYQRLILDQGYFKDSGLTPPDEEALIRDIDKTAALGYNGVRKHQKTEDERFLFWCDIKGMLVWCEAPSTYEFDDQMTGRFLEEWNAIVRQNYNHPSIIAWTPVNESWGVQRIRTEAVQQAFTQAVYYMTKAIDPMRPVIVNDGWEHTVSDIVTLHDYQESGGKFYEKYNQGGGRILGNEESLNGSKYAFAEGFQYRGQPVIVSEYGGIAFQSGSNGWGYGNKVTGEESFFKRFEEITAAIQKIPYVCGYCYTQVTDVQQEINGVMDMDRNYKVDPERYREINTKSFRY